VTRAECLELTKKLLDDGRLSDDQIADVVGRSKRWVRKIVREHPRYSKVEVIYAPTPTPNITGEPHPTNKKSPSLRTRWRKFKKTVVGALEAVGIVALLSLYAVGIVRNAQRRKVNHS